MSDEILIELRAMRATQLEQSAVLSRLDERTLATNTKLDDHLNDDKDFHEKAGDRLGKLEQWKSRVGGIIVAASVIFGALFTVAREALAYFSKGH